VFFVLIHSQSFIRSLSETKPLGMAQPLARKARMAPSWNRSPLYRIASGHPEAKRMEDPLINMQSSTRRSLTNKCMTPSDKRRGKPQAQTKTQAQAEFGRPLPHSKEWPEPQCSLFVHVCQSAFFKKIARFCKRAKQQGGEAVSRPQSAIAQCLKRDRPYSLSQRING
jgi:hypothetical protein